MRSVIADAKARMIAEGLASVRSTYEDDDPRLAGALEGFEIARELTSREDFERVLLARHSREQRMLSGFYRVVHERVQQDLSEAGIESEQLSKPVIETDDDRFWRHRYGTLQIEFVYQRLAVLWAFGLA